MDEKGRELGELRDYGKKLLDEMQYKDIIAMVGETITHIADIAEEYSKEAENWRGKYEESARENKDLRDKLTDLTEASDKQVNELRDIIGKQAEKIEGMGRDFEKKMEELYSYRKAEINGYNKKAEGLIATQNALENIKSEVEKEKEGLEKDRQSYKDKKAECERTRIELQSQIENNQTKINEYEGLFNYKLDAEKEIAKVKNEAKTQIDAANETAAGWERKFGEEYKKRETLEKELEKLKKQLQVNAEDNNTEDVVPQNNEVNSQDTSSADEDGDDGNR